MQLLEPLSMHSAILSLLKWVDEQDTLFLKTKHDKLCAQRKQIQVVPGHNAPLAWLRAQCCAQKLFFRSREEQFEVAAVGFVHLESGPVFTPDVQLSLLAMLNPECPEMRIYGGCRFDASPDARRDLEWEPYSGFTFVLPAVELNRSRNGRFYLVANYYPPSGGEYLKGILRHLKLTPIGLQSVSPSFMIPRAEQTVDITDFPTWNAAMSTILKQLSTKEYSKIVLARRKRFSFSSQTRLDPVHVIAALDEQNEGPGLQQCRSEFSSHGNKTERPEGTQISYLFCLQIDYEKAFVGCTPELLFFSQNQEVSTEALAGTVARGFVGDELDLIDELQSEKNLEEHRFVVEFITAALSKCGIEAKKDGPHVRRLTRLMHLSTKIRGEFPSAPASENNAYPVAVDSTQSQQNVFHLLRTMHPTPAVCGMPRGRTMSELHSLEQFDRGFFSGPLGWFSANAGEFCVAIRSALIHGNDITAFAGSGIVQASESKSEWDETEIKMSAFTELFRSDLPLKESVCESAPRKLMLCHFELPDRCNISNGRATHPNSYFQSTEENEKEGNKLGNISTGTSIKDSNSGAFYHHRRLSGLQLPSPVSFFDPRLLETMPNLNSLWGCCSIEEFCRNGISTYFVAPGSRSAPLAVGVVMSAHARFFVAHDERGAGFLAVGFARATKRAAVVITSSGTAVANLLPAIVEAYMESLPVIVLTADRPPELRDVGANQSIRQVGIFGSYVLWSRDLPCPSSEIPLANLLSDVDHAVYVSGSASLHEPNNFGVRSRGPVHLNFMFREKLAPDIQPWDGGASQGVGKRWRESCLPWTSYVESGTCVSTIPGPSNGYFLEGLSSTTFKLLANLNEKEFGIVLVAGGFGSAETEDDILVVYEIARYLGWPIISDVCGGLRFVRSHEDIVHYADQIYASEVAQEHMLPTAIIQIGEKVTSKGICQMIKRASATDTMFLHVLVSASAQRVDPSMTVTHRISCNIAQFWMDLSRHSIRSGVRYPAPEIGGQSNGNLKCNEKMPKSIKLKLLSKAVHTLLAKLSQADEEKQLTEPWCARTISENLQAPAALFIGNSMPIRDFDAYSSALDSGLQIRVAANRGACGIDGIISSGIGFGIGHNLDVTIVLGDMSMIHDMNALHLLRKDENSIKVRVTLLIINNGGSGIFSLLPIAKHHEVFSPIFDTPHTIEFRKVCETFGIQYCSVSTSRQLKEVLRHEDRRHRIIEALVSDDHQGNADLHERLRTQVAELVKESVEQRCQLE